MEVWDVIFGPFFLLLLDKRGNWQCFLNIVVSFTVMKRNLLKSLMVNT